MDSEAWPGNAGRGDAVAIPIDAGCLHADLVVPFRPAGLVIFAHGSGSSRQSPRNRFVARTLEIRGLATLVADLLTADEERVDVRNAALRFDIPRLGARVQSIIEWARGDSRVRDLPTGLFGASTGAAAALVAAAARREVRAVVSRGGRPDLAAAVLPRVTVPTLLIVGSRDGEVLTLNRRAAALMPGTVAIEVVPGATHLFEEPGALEAVAGRAAAWFTEYLADAR